VEARPTPQAVPGLAGISAIYAGRNHAFALTTSGQVYSWGRNDAGQLGVDLPSSSPLATDYDSGAPVSYLSAPHQVFFPGPVATVTTIAAGQDHSLAMTNDGVYTWGSNRLGQLGDSSTGFRYQPAKVSGLPANIAGIAAEGYSSFAWTPDGDVYAWGDNEFGELGNGTSQNNVSVPTLITWGPWSSP
jgi:alpha-tubulin suppressor-like RCC1 family protein